MENNNENLKISNSENSSFFEQKVSSSNGNEDFIPRLNFDKTNRKNWEIINFDKLFSFLTNNTLSRKELSEHGEVKNIHYGDILIKYGNCVDVSEDDIPYVDINAKLTNNIDFLNNGDVIIADTAEDTTAGTAIEIYNIGDAKIVSGLHTFACRPNLKFSSKYLGYYMNSSAYHSQLLPIMQGIKVLSISKTNILNTQIMFPEQKYQNKIANFLSLIDQRIEKQRQLVESLKKYKRGLLFRIFKIDNKTWSSSNLGDLCDITTGKLDANAMCSNGIYRFYTCAKEFYYINDYAFDTDALLISGNGANVGYIHHYNGKFNAYQRTYVLDNFKQNIIYIKYYLETFLRQRIESEKKAGNTPYIVLSTLSNFKIKYPAINEQDLIAKFLSEIDTVIEKQEILLDQILTTKQGLLQQMFI